MAERYIPASRQGLIEVLCRSARLSTKKRTQFRQFSEILSAYAHFTGQKNLELMKLAFANFDPNADTQGKPEPDAKAHADAARVFIDAFDRTARRENY